MTAPMTVDVVRERPTALQPGSRGAGSVRPLDPVQGGTSAAAERRRRGWNDAPLRLGDGPPLSEGDLFAASSLGVREGWR